MKTKVTDFIISETLWVNLQRRKKMHKKARKGFAGYNLYTGNDTATTLMARYSKDGSDILIDRVEGNCRRMLTYVECERLQGFPDHWSDGLSAIQRYKCLGNAVTTTVVTAILDRLYK